MSAIVTPEFVDDASAVHVISGDNTPFSFVSWTALQSAVVGDGVTFTVQPVEIGANQDAIPVGEATSVTCGPFDCVTGTDAPALSIANESKAIGD